MSGKTSSFKYPGKEYRKFLQMVGKMTWEGYRHVVVSPTQTRNVSGGKSGLNDRYTEHITISLLDDDRRKVFDLRDFVGSFVKDRRVEQTVQEENLLLALAEELGEELKARVPNAIVDVKLIHKRTSDR